MGHLRQSTNEEGEGAALQQEAGSGVRASVGSDDIWNERRQHSLACVSRATTDGASMRPAALHANCEQKCRCSLLECEFKKLSVS